MTKFDERRDSTCYFGRCAVLLVAVLGVLVPSPAVAQGGAPYQALAELDGPLTASPADVDAWLQDVEGTWGVYRANPESIPTAMDFLVPPLPTGTPPIGLDPADPVAAQPAMFSVEYEIRLLLLVTPDWLLRVGGTLTFNDSHRQRLGWFLSFTSEALRRSGLAVRFSGPVYSGRLNLTRIDDLLHSITADQALEAIRQNEAADLVVLIGTDFLPTTACGIAWLPYWPQRAAAHAVVKDTYLSSGACTALSAPLTFAHELGHLFGADHDRVTTLFSINNGQRTGFGVPSYIAGWQDCGHSRGIMSYSWSCNALWGLPAGVLYPLYANPLRVRDGLSQGRLGVEETHTVTGPAFAARRIREMLPFVSAYSDGCCR